MECVSRSLPPRRRPSPLEWRVGSHNDISRPAQCSLTLRPARTVDPHKGHIFGVLQVIRCLLTRPEYFRLERELAGLGFHQGEQCALQGTHTNPVENQIRPLILTRKNSLFAGHDEGGRSWARIASLIATCKINSVEPYAWMKATLEAIATSHPQPRGSVKIPRVWSLETPPLDNRGQRR